jgi:hypothetical protein
MSQKRIKSLLFPGILAVFFLCACILYVDFLLQRPSVQRFLVEKLSRAAGYDVKVASFHMSLLRGFKITVQGLSASSRDQKEHIAASIARIGLDGKALLSGDIIPRSLDLDNPVISFSLQGQKGGPEASVEEMLGKIGFLKLAAMRSLSITGGQVKIKGSPFSLQSLFLKVSRNGGETPGQVIHLKTALGFRGQYIPFHLQGHMRYGKGEAKAWVDFTGEALKIPVSWVPWPRFAPFSAGLIDVGFHAAGRPGDSFSAGGTFHGRSLRFAISQEDRRKQYALSSMSVDFNARLDNGVLKVQIPHAKMFDTSLSAQISFEPAKPSPRLGLSIQSPLMPLETFKKIFPTSLVPAWVEKNLFPCLSGGEVAADHFSLIGTLDQIEHLDRPGNARALAMTVSWRNLDVLKNGYSLPFEAVAGKMEIKRNVLKISRLQTQFGTSTVKDASLTVSPLIGDACVYSIVLDGQFALQDLVTMRQLPWTPGELRKKLTAFTGSSGLLNARLTAVRKENQTVPHIENGTFKFHECTFVHKAFVLPVRVEKGEMQIKDDGPVHFTGSGSWGRSALVVSGSTDRSIENFTTKVAGTLDLDALAAALFPGKTWNLHFGEPVACDMDVAKKGVAWSFAGMIDPHEEAALQVGSLQLNPLGKKGRLSFGLDYIPGKSLRVGSLDGRFGKSSFSASGAVVLSGEKKVTAEMNIPGLFLRDLGVQFEGGSPVAGGFVSGSLHAEFPLNDPLSSTLTGELEARDLGLTLEGHSSPLTGGGFRTLFSGHELTIKFMGFTMGKSSIEIQGTLHGWKALQGSLTVRSDEIDPADFLPGKPRQSPKRGDSFFESLLEHSAQLAVSFRASRVNWREMRMGPFTGDGILKKGMFHLLNARLHSKHGFITVKGDFGGNETRKITFLSHIRLFEQPVQDLFHSFNVQRYYIEGQLSTDILLSGEGHDKKSLIAGLQGKGKLLVEKGVIRKSNVLIKILDFLSIQKIFRHPPPNLSKEGFYFDKIGADFEMKKGVLSTENLMMRSPVFNGAAQGTLDLPRTWVKADFGVQPLVTLDSLVSKIPIVGYILTGKNKALLVYYFKVEGPLSSPDVKYVPLKNWGNSIMGYITRIFLTPPRLFEKLMHLRKPAEK